MAAMSLHSLIDRVLRLAGGTPDEARLLEPRHARRERALTRHRATGAPVWPEEERHLNPDGAREVADVAPGTPGSGASRRVIGRRP